MLEHCDSGHRPEPPSFSAHLLHEPRGEIIAAEIGCEALAHAGPQHLHRQIAPVGAHCLVDLGDRGGGNGWPEGHEELVHVLEEVVTHDLPGDVGRKGRQPVLQRLQFEGAAGAHEIGPGGEELPKLDVAGTQRGQCCGDCGLARLFRLSRAELRNREAEPRGPRKLLDLLGRHERVIGRERAARPQQVEAVPQACEHQMRQPEWIATTPPVRLR